MKSSKPLHHPTRQPLPCLCGCCCRRWPVLQRLCHINTFMVIFSGLFIISLSVAGYLAGVLSTLEKRFQLKSAEVGALSSVSSAVSLSLVVFLSYYGQNQHRPRWIALGAVFLGIGTILMAFPQLVYDTPAFLITDAPVTNTTNADGGSFQSSTHLCQIGGNLNGSSLCGDEGNEDGRTRSLYGVGWLITGQILIGIGGSAFLPLAITFIDDNVPRTSTPMYVGILFASSGIAPLIGLGSSSVSLSYYSDYYKSDAPDISPDDPNWLGAWWMGFLIYGILTLILAVPMFMFPKRLSGHGSSEKIDIEAVSKPSDNVADMLDLTSVVYRPTSVPNPDAESTVKCGVVKGFLIALRRILTNPAFIIIVLGVCAVFAAMSGFLTFGAKYIETQYGVSPSLSPLILGGMVAPGGILGNFLGGFIVNRYRLNEMQCGRMILLIALPMTVISPCLYFFGCNNLAVAGLTVNYNTTASNMNTMHSNMTYIDMSSLSPSTISQCNSDCQCEKNYHPVCGNDGVTYMSPCHAGCTETMMNEDNSTTIYQNCGCVSRTSNSSIGDVQSIGYAHKGECGRECDKLWVFAGVFMTVFLFSCIWSNPAFMLYLRVVDAKDRAIAVGFASLALKALGFIPAPIFYGKAIQSTCILEWQLSCEETGSCIVYDLPSFRAKFLGLSYGLQVLASLMMCLGYFAIKRQTMKRGFHSLGDVRIERRPTSLPPVEESDTSSLPTSQLTSEDIANANGNPKAAL